MSDARRTSRTIIISSRHRRRVQPARWAAALTAQRRRQPPSTRTPMYGWPAVMADYFDLAAALPPLRPAALCCAWVPPWLLLPDPECDFSPPCLESAYRPRHLRSSGVIGRVICIAVFGGHLSAVQPCGERRCASIWRPLWRDSVDGPSSRRVVHESSPQDALTTVFASVADAVRSFERCRRGSTPRLNGEPGSSARRPCTKRSRISSRHCPHASSSATPRLGRGRMRWGRVG